VPVVSAQGLQKSFGPQTILKDVTFTLRTGERVGLVGVNGTGKSTLARIVAGVEPADAGSVARRRGASIAYLAQEPVFDPELTPRKVVLAGLDAWSAAKARHERASLALGRGDGDVDALLVEQAEAATDVERLGGWDVGHQVDAVLEHVGVGRPDEPLGSMSGGERRRIALARILVAKPSLAVLDEPTNHLDVETVEWLERYLVEELPGALLLITHDRYFLDRVVQRTLELDQGSLYDYDGGYEEYLEAKTERLALEARTESNRQNFLRRELEWLRRQPKARTGKQKARIQRAETAKAAPPPKAERTVDLQAEAVRSGKTILELADLRLEAGGKTLVQRLDWMLVPGERVGVVGRNGTGKTTLLRALLGEVEPAAGQVTIGKNTQIAYFDQHRVGLDDARSIFDNVSDAGGKIELAGRPMETRSYLERFLFDSHKQRQPVGSLSGGERARVALAKLLARPHNLLLLDEPTNDLDVATLGALEEMLVEQGGSAIVVTHDRWFLNRVATSILAFEGDGKVVRYAGGYDDYRAQRAMAEAAAQPEPVKEPPREKEKAPPKPKSKSQGLTYAERKELDGILDRIDAAEGAVKDLEATLADPALYATRGHEVAGVKASLEKARDDVARLVARWEELEAKRET
jgi:ATP-binding cassette subfamily F protein uup